MSNAENILTFPNSGDRDGDRHAVGSVAEFLRLNRLLKAKEAPASVKRAYYAAQLCLAGEMDADEGRLILEGALIDFATKISGGKEGADLKWIAAELREGDLFPYEVMQRLAAVLDFKLDDDSPERSLLDEWARWREIASERRCKEAGTAKEEELYSADGMGSDAAGL